LRRRVSLLALLAALTWALPGSAALLPVRHGRGEVTIPPVRVGTVTIPPRSEQGRVRVVVRLAQPPLAQAFARRLQSVSPRKLDVTTSFSRAYLRQLETAQRLAVAQLHAALGAARVQQRYRVVFDGFALTLPARSLPKLARLPFVRKVYPSLTYSLALDRSPSVIGASQLEAATGQTGNAIKIAVVDDGVDNLNPFFNPAGYSYPAGFPRGGGQWVSPKVIVAKAFPGPGSGRRGRLPVDRQASFHGTHVAGIAAGDAGTNAPRGIDHPAVSGLSGVAPGAWIGNYRVFTVPTPIGNVANTPEVIQAFEAAVEDGMDVINFSGGAPATDPVNDALLEAVDNVAAAGVVPVIAAANDREEFGLGTAASPGNAPAAISVAATSSAHVFAPALSVSSAGAPGILTAIPLEAGPNEIPSLWGFADEPLVDVGTIVGRNGSPVERQLCGPPQEPNGGTNPLPPGSLQGAIALVLRGSCTFVSKSERVREAGGIGIVLVDNRSGEANSLPVQLTVPGGMIADLDGARLRSYLATSGGRTTVRIGRDPLELETGRSGIVTSFSSAGPTAFGHLLKPDVSAPGGQILSSTLPEFAGSPFMVLDGTSMAAPHVAGAAALLRQRHPGWTVQQLKSALVDSAGPAWGDTARTQEASVLLEGGGLVNVQAADDPRIFTDPVSLSFGDLDLNHGAQTRSLLARITDAGDGAGVWSVELKPQAASAGVSIVVPPAVSLAPGDDAEVAVRVRAGADATAGDQYGFVVLRHGTVERRIPYYAAVNRPGLESLPATQLRGLQSGDTRTGVSHAERYRFPDHAFGPAPNYTGPPMNEDGAEKLYTILLSDPVINFGVAVVGGSSGSLVDPWLLGSKDENDVQGYAGTPVNVNSLTFNYRFDVGAAGAVFPRPKRYFFSVDSGRDPFTGASLAGPYLLHSWVNDLRPPLAGLATRRVAAGRPLVVVRARDLQSGVDPSSLVFAYRNVLVGAAFYDSSSGVAIFALPPEAPALPVGKTPAVLVAADYQESKTVNAPGGAILPNTVFRRITIRAVRGPAVTWVAPEARTCVARRERLIVAASSTRRIAKVAFFDGPRRIATVRRGVEGLFAATWSTRGAKRGLHRLGTIATDTAGRSARAVRTVRVCKRAG
jgi:subtilisin family serine protease